ncbi:MAG: hypothetical protein K2P14_09580 [Anaeroplasmataceae bacterium]|nr:hypothetical protein [Anaeroplasmataceae bacterium]
MSFKDIWNRAKDKFNEVVEKGNKEIKKYQVTKKVSIYSLPILGGFVSAHAFLEQNKLYLLVNEVEEKEIKEEMIIGLSLDPELYVIKKMIKEEHKKEVKEENKTYSYNCYEAELVKLNDYFLEQTNQLPYKELTVHQVELLQTIHKTIEEKGLAVKDKKEVALKLWQYFTECISYGLKDHFIMHTFSKIANDYIEDFSSYLLKLFA